MTISKEDGRGKCRDEKWGRENGDRDIEIGMDIVLKTYDCHEIVEDEDHGDAEEVDDVVVEEDVQKRSAIVELDLLRCIFDGFIDDEAK